MDLLIFFIMAFAFFGISMSLDHTNKKKTALGFISLVVLIGAIVVLVA